MLLYIAIHLTPVQNWIVKKVAANLSNKLHTKVSVKKVDFTLFNKMSIQGLMLEDKKGDTLLYAGEARVQITDWFFLKDKAVLHYLSLNDAVIKASRTDSVWNYQFLLDYFSSPKKSSSSSTGMSFDFKKIELNQVRISQKDGWVGTDLSFSLAAGAINAKIIDLDKKIIQIESIALNSPYFGQYDYTGNRIKRPVSVGDTIQTKSTNSPWQLDIGQLFIKNGGLAIDQQTDRAPFENQFDGQHFHFYAIDAKFSKVKYSGDSVIAQLQIAAKEKSGLEVKKLSADMKCTASIMEFKQLDLQTNKSHIGNYYAMHYEDFNNDMASFLHRIKLAAHFDHSIVHSDDIAFFAPELKYWNRFFDINGNALGTIDNLSAKAIQVKSGSTSLQGDISLHGLPDIDNTFIDFSGGNIQTNYTDLSNLVPSLAEITQPRLSSMGNILYKGNFTGFIRDFVTYGTLTTNLGTLVTDVNMKLPINGSALYAGKIITNRFNLGGFLNNTQVGTISLNGKINGVGFGGKNLKTAFEGNISQLEYLGYNYQQIKVDGKLENKLFNGNIAINDPHFIMEKMKGVINFNDQLPEFNIVADIKKIDFKKLQLTTDDFVIGGHLAVDFAGDNIDNFNGRARINQAVLIHDGMPLSFDSLELASIMNVDSKELSFKTNEATGNIKGNFVIHQLPDAFQLFLNKYYPTYFKQPNRAISNQDFAFHITTKKVDAFVQLLDAKLEGFDNAVFDGTLKIPGNEMELTARIPSFTYDGKTFSNLRLNSKGLGNKLFSTIEVGEIALSDSFHFPKTNLSLLTEDGVTNLQLKTSADKTLSRAELNASIKPLADGLQIHFFPSSFYINNKKWDLEKDGEITLRKNVLDANEVKFVQGNQEIVISTEMDEELGSNLVAKLKKINLDDFAPFVIKDPRMEGQLTGTLTLRDPFGKQLLEFEGKAADFVLENKSIANIDLYAAADLKKGKIQFNGKGLDKNDAFEFNGSYDLMDTTDHALNIGFTAQRFDMNNLAPYLNNIFTDLQGNIVADLKVTGGAKHQYITGSVLVKEGSMKVIYTNCKYKFANETILFNPDEMDLGTLELKDTLGNTATAGGIMTHQFFDNFGFDNIYFKTDRMLLLNTTKRENPDFYGKIIGNANMTLNGPISNLKMKIDGGPSTIVADDNHFFLPSSNSKEVGTIDYIEFVQFGRKMQNELSNREGTNISIDMNISANPACKVDVILDEATGDIIKGQGRGQLKIHVGNKEPLTMSGRYDISKGEYSFNFQTFIKKYFEITNGYINWNKDPYEANINIDAVYTATKVDLSSLNTSKGKFNQRADLNVVAHLTNTLKSPKINFEFKIPAQQTEFGNDPIVLESLKKFSQDENEMNKQVASLLLFNSFINNSNAGGITGSGLSFFSGTAGQLVSNFLNNQFSKIFQKIFNDPTITPYLSLNSNYDPTSPEILKALQASGNFGLKKEYINGRLIVSLGGNVDYNNPYILAARNTNILLTPDITLEYILSNDGKLRILGFNRTSVDATLGQRNRTGMSLAYSKDFNHFFELFTPSEEKKRRKGAKKAAQKEQ